MDKDYQKEYDSLLKIAEEAPITSLTILKNINGDVVEQDHYDPSEKS